MRAVTCFIICFLLAGCGFYSSNQEKEAEKKSVRLVETKSQEPQKNGNIEPFRSYQKDVNILLLGTDSRGESASRSDTIMLTRYEPRKQTLKIVSIMRDSFVQIPGHGKSKLNHAFYFGGEQLVKQTIEKNFNVSIDHVALIDFNGFIDIVDSIAPNGIEVPITKEMVNHLPGNMSPGEQRLDSQQLLEYIRFRQDSSSDFGRIKRQQDVLIALKNEALTTFTTMEGLRRFPQVISDIANQVESDIEPTDYMSLGATFVLNPIEAVETFRIPVEDSFSNQRVHGSGQVLQMDLQKNAEELNRFLFQPTE